MIDEEQLKLERAELVEVNQRGFGARFVYYARRSGPGWLQGAITLGGGSLDHYHSSHSCSKSSPGCTYENGVAGLLRFPAPNASGEPTVDEQTGFAPPVGTVRHEVYDGGELVINIALGGKHILYPGTCRRWVTQDADSVTIHTYGEGAGGFPRLNEFFADSLWRRVDNKIFDYMSQ